MPERLEYALIAHALMLWSVSAAGAAEGTGRTYVPNSIDDPNIYSVSLSDLDGNGFLRGDAADVTNAMIARAYSAALDFTYDPGQSTDSRIHFGETMAYHHITSYYNYVRGLGFQEPNRPVSVVAFNAMPFGQLWIPIATAYNPNDGSISLTSDPSADESDAMDGDAIVHEYAHAVQHQLRGGTLGVFVSGQTTEADHAGAVMEGLADYATTSFFDDPEVAEWSASTLRSNAFYRTVENFSRWPEGLAEKRPHTVGASLSGAMWDLRAVVGTGVADMLALKTVQTVPDGNLATPELNTTFTDVLDTILQVDTDLYGGAHADEILQAFAVHGIGEYDFSTPFPMVRDPNNDYDGNQAYSIAGAEALAVTFDEFVTKLDDAWFTKDMAPRSGIDEKTTVDYLEILDGNGDLVGTYTGRELQGATIVVPGDTVRFHLVTDSYLAPFGYRVVDITPIGWGDVNGDGNIDSLDISPFVAAMLAADEDAFSTAYPDYQYWAGDVNEDGNVDALDITPFINLLTGGGSEVPEPATMVLMGLGGLALVLKWRRRYT